MRTKLFKIALAATLGFAITFTLSCSSDDGNGDGHKEVIATEVRTSIGYGDNGEVKETYEDRYEYKYDNKGNMIERIEYNYDGSIYDRTEYKYDNKGNMIEEFHYDSDGSIRYKEGGYEYRYKYDSKGNVIERIKYNYEEGNIIGRSEYKYDNKGDMIERIEYNYDDEKEGRSEYKYDSKGNEIEYVRYDSDGNIKGRSERTWSNDGNSCTENWYRGAEIYRAYEWKYITINSKKLIEEVRSIYFGEYSIALGKQYGDKNEYEYDSRGNITKETNYDWQDGRYVKSSERTYVYTYIRL